MLASMVQHISNSRVSKQLKATDIVEMAYACCFNLFHTDTQFKPWPFGVYVVTDWSYVKRINNSNYQSQFCWTSTYLGSPPNAIDRSIGSVETYSSVDSDLMGSKDGDEHLKLTVHYRMIDFDKSKLGFFFLNPKFTRIYGTTLDDIFSSNIVITPKPGLFPIKNE